MDYILYDFERAIVKEDRLADRLPIDAPDLLKYQDRYFNRAYTENSKEVYFETSLVDLDMR